MTQQSALERSVQASLSQPLQSKKLFPLFNTSRSSQIKTSQSVGNSEPTTSSDPLDILGHNDAKKSAKIKKATKPANGSSTATIMPVHTKDPASIRNNGDAEEVSDDVLAPLLPALTPGPSEQQARAVTPTRFEDNIIVISDSPVRESIPIKTFADYDAERRAKRAKKAASGWSGKQNPPWPTSESCHVQPKSAASEYASLIPYQVPRSSGKLPIRTLEALPRGCTTSQAYEHLRSLFALPKHVFRDSSSTSDTQKDHPSYASSTGQSKAGGSTQNVASIQQLWTSAWAPRKAEEILGDANRSNGLYLRKWLEDQSLADLNEEIGNDSGSALSTRKRKIQRGLSSHQRKRMKRANKRSKRLANSILPDDDDLADFIASETEEELYYDYYDLDSRSVPISPTKSQVSSIAESSALTNAILLCGPVGSGKTCTVYAVAQELDWQVFEVFPGIGKRGQRDIDRYVGMVGQNHIVHTHELGATSGTGKPPRGGLQGFFSMANSGKIASMEPVNSTTASNEVTTETEAASASGKVRQSLVLIEEVDILFASDQGFWDALIHFIGESRRPVVMTCNDPSDIPYTRLALQKTLIFEPVGEAVALSRLRSILREQRGASDSKTLLDTNLHCNTLHMQPQAVDIRQILSQMQYQSVMQSDQITVPQASLRINGERQTETPIKQLAATADVLSFIDAEIVRRAFMRHEDEENIDLSAEDALAGHSETSYRQILQIPAVPIQVPLPAYGREAEIAQCIVGVDIDAIETDIKSAPGAASETRIAISRELLAYSTIDRKMLTETLPYLQEIVAIDDILEIAFNEAVKAEAEEAVIDTRVRRSRRLAGAAREAYPRYKGISGDIAEMIRSTRFSGQNVSMEERHIA